MTPQLQFWSTLLSIAAGIMSLGLGVVAIILARRYSRLSSGDAEEIKRFSLSNQELAGRIHATATESRKLEEQARQTAEESKRISEDVQRAAEKILGEISSMGSGLKELEKEYIARVKDSLWYRITNQVSNPLTRFIARELSPTIQKIDSLAAEAQSMQPSEFVNPKKLRGLKKHIEGVAFRLRRLARRIPVRMSLLDRLQAIEFAGGKATFGELFSALWMEHTEQALKRELMYLAYQGIVRLPISVKSHNDIGPTTPVELITKG